MRKQTKLVAVLSAAALLAIGASMTSFAATPHWAEEDGVWVYLDSDGERVTNEWKKSNGSWYYLNDDGEMAIDSWIDSDYYVGTDGKMITNNWSKLTDEDADDQDPDESTEHWYYFDSKGKKETDAKKTINGKVYFFDTDGRMRDGWYQDDSSNVYYLGGEDDGARKSGWLWLEPEDDDDVDVEPDDCGICEAEGWYWFDANGKMHNSGKNKKINGKQYYFNEHGQMLYNWVQLATTSNAYNLPDTDRDDSVDKIASDVSDMRYTFGVNKGYRVDGWIKVNGADALGNADDEDWYFFKSGEAKHAVKGTDDVTLLDSSTGQNFTRTIKKIKVEGKDFAFDENGAMCDGLQAISDGAKGYYTYYFDASAGMKTGKISNVEEDDGDTYTYYFSTSGSNKGRGIDGEKDGYLYYYGRRQEADDDYRIYEYPVNSGDYYLVNKTGKIQKSTGNSGKKYSADKIENEYSTLADDVYISTNKSGKILKAWYKTDSGTEDAMGDLGADEVAQPDWED